MPRISIRSFRYYRPENPTWDVELEESLRPKRDTLSKPLSLSELFGNDAPVEVEIGFGKGRFLLAAAERWPDHNWLGIEYAPQCVMVAAERAAKRELRNIRVINAAAEDILSEHLVEGCVHAYHIYFPDPWPKKRHRKRRLVKAPLVRQLHRTIETGGSVHVATDFTQYYEEMVPIFEGNGFELVEHPEAREDEVFLTNYERKFLTQGKKISRARFVKA